MLERFRRVHQDRHINAVIGLQADAVAETIIDHINRGDEPPYRFNAQGAPKPLTAEQFSLAVGRTAIGQVRGEIDTSVDYDHAASRQATMEFPAIKPGSPVPDTGGVIVVFQ